MVGYEWIIFGPFLFNKMCDDSSQSEVPNQQSTAMSRPKPLCLFRRIVNVKSLLGATNNFMHHDIVLCCELSVADTSSRILLWK